MGAALITFDLVERSDDGGHIFAVYDCGSDEDGALISDLAQVIRELYVEPDKLRPVLTAALNDLGPVADVVTIGEIMERVLPAAVPDPHVENPDRPWLNVARNELAEAIALVGLSDVHGTVIPAPRIRHKEIPGAPVRGRDLLGLEDDPLTVIIGEVKASDEQASPPGVVGSGAGSMRGQFQSFLAAHDALLTELSWVMKHSPTEHRLLVAKAMTAHVAGVLGLCVAPVLVRPKDRHGVSDFGTFKDNPGQFNPARVRFSIFRIDETLNGLAKAVYSEARR